MAHTHASYIVHLWLKAGTIYFRHSCTAHTNVRIFAKIEIDIALIALN